MMIGGGRGRKRRRGKRDCGKWRCKFMTNM